MAFGTGVATVSFPVSARAAETVTEQVITDSSPTEWVKISSFGSDIVNPQICVGNGVVILRDTTGSTINVSLDGGATWQIVDLLRSITVAGICWTGSRFILHDTSGGWFQSTNGTSWTDQGNTSTVSGAGGCVYDAVRGRVVAATANGVGTGSGYLPDGSNTWSTGGALPSAISNGVMASGQNGFIIFGSNTADTNFTSNDGGTTWTNAVLLAGDQPLKKCVITDNYTVAMTGEIMWRSSTSTGSWGIGWVVNWSIKFGFDLSNGGIATDNTNVLLVGPTNGRTLWFTIPNDAQPGYSGAKMSSIATSGDFRTAAYDVTNNRFIVINTNAAGGGVYVMKPNVRTINNNSKTIKPVITNMGTNSITYTVTGLASITADASVEVFMMASDSTASHNTIEHELADITLSVENIVPGTGFDIVATSKQRLDGDFKVRYVWST